MEELDLIKILWDYMDLKQRPEKSDCIIVLGCSDTSLVDIAVDLYCKNYSDKIIFCGGFGKITKNIWNETEADKFAKLAIEKGIPKESIYIENKSTNTGDNFRFAKKLMQDVGLNIQTCLIVCKPYDARRNDATFRKILPEMKGIFITSEVSCEEYYKTHSKEWIDVLVGDIQRMKVYPELGWQVKVDIPIKVWQAYEELVKRGYDKYIIQEK